jgi:hypothetical protein
MDNVAHLVETDDCDEQHCAGGNDAAVVRDNK